jgi:hypothetical protein
VGLDRYPVTERSQLQRVLGLMGLMVLLVLLALLELRGLLALRAFWSFLTLQSRLILCFHKVEELE